VWRAIPTANNGLKFSHRKSARHWRIHENALSESTIFRGF
jgi:hypothetical protein